MRQPSALPKHDPLINSTLPSAYTTRLISTATILPPTSEHAPSLRCKWSMASNATPFCAAAACQIRRHPVRETCCAATCPPRSPVSVLSAPTDPRRIYCFANGRLSLGNFFFSISLLLGPFRNPFTFSLPPRRSLVVTILHAPPFLAGLMMITNSYCFLRRLTPIAGLESP